MGDNLARRRRERMQERREEQNSFSKSIKDDFNHQNDPHIGLTTLTAIRRIFAPDSFDSQLSTIPDRKDLPTDISEFLDSLEGKSDMEKIRSIHEFTVNNLTYAYPSGEDETTGPRDMIYGPRVGDCDDFAFFECALLRYAGFEDVAFFGGDIKYQEASSNASLGGEGHAVAVVEVDGERYLLDLNLPGPVHVPAGQNSGIYPIPGTTDGIRLVVEDAYLMIEYGNNRHVSKWRQEEAEANQTIANATPLDQTETPTLETVTPE